MFHADHSRYSLVALVPHMACHSCQQDIHQYLPTGGVLQMLLPLLSPTIVQISLVPPGTLLTLSRLMLYPLKMGQLTVLIVSVMAWPMNSVPFNQCLLMSPRPLYHLPLHLPPAVLRLYDDLIHLVEEAIALLSLIYNHTTFLNLHLYHLVNCLPLPPDQGQVQEISSKNGRGQKMRRNYTMMLELKC